MSTLTLLSACTAPKAREIDCACSRGALQVLGELDSGVSVASTTASSPFGNCDRCLVRHLADQQVRLERATAPILKDDLRLNGDSVIRAVQCFDEIRILLGHKPTPDLPGPGQLTIIRVEFFVQDKEALDLRPHHLWIVRQTGIDASNFSLHEIVDLWPGREIGIARVGQPAAFCPVANRLEVDIDKSPHERSLLAMDNSLFDEWAEF